MRLNAAATEICSTPNVAVITADTRPRICHRETESGSRVDQGYPPIAESNERSAVSCFTHPTHNCAIARHLVESQTFRLCIEDTQLSLRQVNRKTQRAENVGRIEYAVDGTRKIGYNGRDCIG